MHTPTHAQTTVPPAQLQHVPSFSLLDGCHGDVIDKVDEITLCGLLEVLCGTFRVNGALLNHSSFNEKIKQKGCGTLSLFSVVKHKLLLLLLGWINCLSDLPDNKHLSLFHCTLRS